MIMITTAADLRLLAIPLLLLAETPVIETTAITVSRPGAEEQKTETPA